MSVSQIKKATAALKAYLHKDEKGQQLLDALTRNVSTLRATASSQAEQLDAAERIKCRVCNERDSALISVRELERENRRLKNNLANSEKEVARLNEQLCVEIDHTFVPLSEGNLVDDLSATRLLRWCRKTLRDIGTLPKPQRAYHKPRGWSLFDVLPALDEIGFATLGRIVALHTMVQGGTWVRMCDEMSSTELQEVWEESDATGFGKALDEYIMIFRNGYDMRTASEALADMTSGKCGWGPEDTGDTTSAVLGTRGED